jgi:large subunit ribosomal protein L9
MANLILRSDVAGVGKRGDIVDVADGYARNYLLPRNLALPAAAGSVSQANAMRRSRDLRDAKDRESAETIARTLVPAIIVVSAKARDGKLFGSVGSADIADAIRTQLNIDLDRKVIHLTDPIKSIGEHSVPVRLHSDVQFQVTVNVQAL